MRLAASAGEIAFEPEIRHHGGDDAGLRQQPLRRPGGGDRRHHLVAVDDLAMLVDNDGTVGFGDDVPAFMQVAGKV